MAKTIMVLAGFRTSLSNQRNGSFNVTDIVQDADNVLVEGIESLTDSEKLSVNPKATADACPEALEMVATRRTDVEAGEMVNEKAPPEIETVDMFKPLPPHHLLPDEPYQLSPRAVLTGWLLGALVHASNIYLAGIGNDANMFATLLGYVALVAFQRMALPLLGGSFGPREHNIIQTVATSTGGLSVLFFSAIPAMYQLGLLTNPREDFGKLVAVSGSAAFFGSAMSVPLRKIFVLEFGRELDLDSSLRQSAIGLVSSFSAATVWTVGSSYARGILWDWNITWLIYQWGNYANRAIYAVNWGFFTIEHASLAVGVAYNPKYPKLMTYMGLESPDLISEPSPRYWLMWPAIRVMICATFTDVLVN
ncbi:hypothetical protein CDV36_010313 [Fusarium kuroshium]|uniref:Oligopeptide transporter n=1 Tax=Fusarium kuroshium TaxID=2010991 RepID=A0A3M2RXV6_9HYPO|nr:hypothetical protein CDV36_010313 [Fusarium kuroshium]